MKPFHLGALSTAFTATVFLAPLPAMAATASTYLYANPENPGQFRGSLKVTFQDAGDKLVIAYGRKHRKDRKEREDTTEEQRQEFKPFKATMADGGRTAFFPYLPRDYYDVVVVTVEDMRLYEGLELLRGASPEAYQEKFFVEVKESLGPRSDRIGGWEGFFDTKQFERLETDGVKGATLLQQMRLGRALAESGAVLKGCIHSIDICWVERAMVEGVGWQVVTRQQLYRGEIPSREFFKHVFVPEFKGIRVGTKDKEIGPIKLP